MATKSVPIGRSIYLGMFGRGAPGLGERSVLGTHHFETTWLIIIPMAHLLEERVADFLEILDKFEHSVLEAALLDLVFGH